MKCSYCKEEVERRWNFCPTCGHSLQRSFMDTVNKQLDQIRKMFISHSYETGLEEPAPDITISIRRGFREPRIVTPEIIEKNTQPYERRCVLPKSVLEPEMKVKRLPNEIIVSVNLPGVRSEEDINLNRLRNSIELRAYAGDKGYFKILKIPYRSRILEKRLEKDNLMMRFSI